MNKVYILQSSALQNRKKIVNIHPKYVFFVKPIFAAAIYISVRQLKQLTNRLRVSTLTRREENFAVKGIFLPSSSRI